MLRCGALLCAVYSFAAMCRAWCVCVCHDRFQALVLRSSPSGTKITFVLSASVSLANAMPTTGTGSHTKPNHEHIKTTNRGQTETERDRYTHTRCVQNWSGWSVSCGEVSRTSALPLNAHDSFLMTVLVVRVIVKALSR